MRDLRQDELSHVYGGNTPPPKGTDQKKTDHKTGKRSDRKTDNKRKST